MFGGGLGRTQSGSPHIYSLLHRIHDITSCIIVEVVRSANIAHFFPVVQALSRKTIIIMVSLSLRLCSLLLYSSS